MEYKLVALDVDGTILNSKHLIAPETRRAVQAAQARGVRVTLATGRAFPSAAMIARKLGLHGTPLVTHDGGYVADPESGAVLHVDRIPLDVAMKATALLQGAGLNVNLLHERMRISNQHIAEFNWNWLNPRNWRAARNALVQGKGYPHIYAADLAAYLARNPVTVPKFYVTGRPDRVRAGAALVAEELGGALRTAAAGAAAMEVMPCHVSKAAGLRVLAEALGIRQDEVIGIGDNYNDVEMISQSGLGVAMGNAPEDVRRLAKFVTRTNDEHGVAYAIERFILGEAV